MGRRHDWTLRPELMRRKAVPVGNWPTIADIPPGALVLDSDGVVKECRWVGNFVNNSTTTLQDTILCNFGFSINSDYELSLTFTSDPANTVPYFGLFCCGGENGLAAKRSLWIERNNLAANCTSSIYSSTGASQSIGDGTVLIDGKFHKLTIKKVGTDISYIVDNILRKTATQTIIANAFTSFQIGSQVSTRSIAGQIAQVRLAHSNPSASFCYEFSEGSGLILNDRCGNGLNGTITDATPTDFWKKALVPVSLLQ